MGFREKYLNEEEYSPLKEKFEPCWTMVLSEADR